MNRAEEIEKIMGKVAQMSPDKQEEFLVAIQIVSGKVPTNQAAVLRVKQRVMEMQQQGYPVGDELIRYFAG